MTRVRVFVVALGAALAANPYATMFLIGLVLFYAGVTQVSRPLAMAAVGAILMLVAAWPFLRVKERK